MLLNLACLKLLVLPSASGMCRSLSRGFRSFSQTDLSLAAVKRGALSKRSLFFNHLLLLMLLVSSSLPPGLLIFPQTMAPLQVPSGLCLHKCQSATLHYSSVCRAVLNVESALTRIRSFLPRSRADYSHTEGYSPVVVRGTNFNCL